MKGVTGRQKLNVDRSGLRLNIQPEKVKEFQLSVMFVRIFPEADQRVFSTLYQRKDVQTACQMNRKDFIEWTRKALIDVARGFWPDVPDNTSYAVVYNRVADFLKERDSQIKAYRG